MTTSFFQRVKHTRTSTDKFVCYFFFVGWDCISLGFHICLGAPNIEIHLPFGFLRIGWETVSRAEKRLRGSYFFITDELLKDYEAMGITFRKETP